MFTLFLSNTAKTAVFALCCEISMVEVRLRFNLVGKFHSAIAEVALQKLKKINSVFCAALLVLCFLCQPLEAAVKKLPVYK